MQNSTRHFVLKRFEEEAGVRVFVFDAVDAAYGRTEYSVQINLAMSRRYGIRLQEMPLLCRGLLDGLAEGDDRRSLTYDEREMCARASSEKQRVEAAAKRKAPKRPLHTERLGAAWRGTMHAPR